MSEADNRVKQAVNAVEAKQGKAASMEGEKSQKESGHASAKSGGVGGYLVPGGSKSK